MGSCVSSLCRQLRTRSTRAQTAAAGMELITSAFLPAAQGQAYIDHLVACTLPWCTPRSIADTVGSKLRLSRAATFCESSKRTCFPVFIVGRKCKRCCLGCTGEYTDMRTAGLEPQPGLVCHGCSTAGIRVEHRLSRLDVIFAAATSGFATHAEAQGWHMRYRNCSRSHSMIAQSPLVQHRWGQLFLGQDLHTAGPLPYRRPYRRGKGGVFSPS